MKVTISLFTSTLLALIIFYGCEKIEREIYSNEDGRYVRFNLMVNSDGQPVDNSRVNPGADVTSLFNNKSVQTIAVPVSITSEPLEEDVMVNFSTEVTGDFTGFTVSPEDQLIFSGSNLTDTIYIDFTERWDSADANQILLKITSVSDLEIKIGNLSGLDKNDELTINLSELILRFNFSSDNLLEIGKTKGESVSFDIEFPDGLFPSELENLDLFETSESEFLYSIVQLPFNENATKISYVITLEEDLLNDNFSYKTVFNLIDSEYYHISGNSSLSVIKPELVERDNSVNTASYFYNLNDPFYRIYGENWMDYNNNDTCTWTSFNAFAYPVIVSSTHPNAVLYDDKGTLDPSDDIYHHAFKMGFNSPNAGNTTNSFNLKRWFNNESISESNSPGFNIPQALEFFPANGNSTTEGLVKVIAQDLIIAGTNGNSYSIAIEGEGTYTLISDGIYEISLEFRATNNELFGGTRTSYYKLYNTDEYADPADRTDGCFKPMDL
jgi:hypothetical protein